MHLLGARLSRRPPLEICLWVTERADAYPAVNESATDVLSHSLEAVGLDVELTVGREPVSLPDEDDERSRRVTWPRMVIEGASGVGPIGPIADVNLLVTDGDVTGRTAGYALPRIAAIGGARHLVALPPADRAGPVVEYSVPAVIGQLLLHECGHALGLDHDHGTVIREDDSVTVSPMVAGYAWAPAPVRRRRLEGDANACGLPRARVADRRRQLSLRFSDCATRAIRRAHWRRFRDSSRTTA